MINIQPIEIPIKGTAVALDVTILPFRLNAESCSSYYKLVSDTNTILLEGNLDIPSSVFLNWGTDDAIVFNYILEALNLTLAE